jgi:NAD(P)-dependent dehydrogenase (short-subunit alcohol dehydrogenase family)
MCVRSGIVDGGILHVTPISVYRRVMEVNFMGTVAMTRRFLPLLMGTRGSRIVNIASVLGTIALPGLGPYSASKHAVEGFTDALRREVAPFGIKVSLLGTVQHDTTARPQATDASLLTALLPPAPLCCGPVSLFPVLWPRRARFPPHSHSGERRE